AAGPPGAACAVPAPRPSPSSPPRFGPHYTLARSPEGEPMERVRVGVIGAGGIVRAVHLPQLQSHGKADVVWFADVDGAVAQDVAARFGVPHAGTDYRALLRERPVDAVTVGTPHNAHYDAVMAALAAGVHVCCEKPLAFDLPQAREMAAEAARRGV